MPLVYEQHINPDTKLGVWHLAEKESFFAQRISLQKDITHPHKRLQHLAGRLLLQELFEDFPLELIRINDTRKPFLEDEAFHFSISHCGDYAAAIVSKRNRVGVDIEVPSEKIERVSHKFLKPEEKLIVVDGVETFHRLTMAWSIKESVFKWYGNGGVDFRQHMNITRLQENGNAYQAACIFSKPELHQHLELHGLKINGNCLSWLVT